MKTLVRPHNALLYYGVLAALYLFLNLLLPANHTTQQLYHLSSLQYHILILLVILPVVAIWLVAFYGYSKIKEYAGLVQNEPEGKAFTFLADGLMWLAWGLPIPALIGVIVNAIANSNPGFEHAAVIITNYANLIVPLIAYHILSSGSRTLLEQNKLRISIASTKLLILIFVTLGAIYCYFMFHNVLGHELLGHNATNFNPYYLSPWLLLFTLVVPYLYAWFVGLLAAYEMHVVSTNSAGLLYQQALQHLSRALVIIVGSSIALQYISSALPRNGHLSLGFLLLIVYMLLLFIGLGYGLLAYGARKLKKIEEV